MILWRISNHADLLGIGGTRSSARWHTQGRPVVDLAENPASALLEAFVHLELDEDDWPESYQLLKIEAQDAIACDLVSLASLPTGWRSEEAVTRSIGDGWLEISRTALLRVPSAITPETWNWLLNPRHSDAGRVQIRAAEAYLYDSRLFRKRPR